MKNKLTKHVLYRAKSRLDLEKSRASDLVKNISKNGRTIGDYTGEFFDFLTSIKNSKSKQIGVKVLDESILIYNKNSKTLITTYKVPKKFIPTSQYLRKKGCPIPLNLSRLAKEDKTLHNLLVEIHTLLNKEVKISLDILSSQTNEVVAGLTIDDEFQNFGIGISKKEARAAALTNYINKLKKENADESRKFRENV